MFIIPSVYGTEVQNPKNSRTAFQVLLWEEQPLESLMSSKESSSATLTYHKHLCQCHPGWEDQSPHLPTCWERGIPPDFLLFWDEGREHHTLQGYCHLWQPVHRTRTNWGQKITTISQGRLGRSTCPDKRVEICLSCMDRDLNSVFLKQSESLAHLKGLRQSFAD